MSSFTCQQCGTDILDSDHGYITGCEHWPIENHAESEAFEEMAAKFEFDNVTTVLIRQQAERKAMNEIVKARAAKMMKTGNFLLLTGINELHHNATSNPRSEAESGCLTGIN